MCNILQKQQYDKDECFYSWEIILPLWIVLNCGPVWLCMFLNKRSKPDPVRDANFLPFVRTDYDKWSYIMTFFTHSFFWPKFVLGWFFFFGSGVLCGLLLIGTDLNAIP